MTIRKNNFNNSQNNVTLYSGTERMQNYWWILALALSLLTASYVWINQFLKVKGSVLMAYRGLGTAVVLLPFCFYFAPIHNIWFYVLCIVQGLVLSIGENRILNSAKAFGAEVTSLIHPVSIAIIFVVWISLHPSELQQLLTQPQKFSLIILCLSGVATALILISKAKANRKALWFLLAAMSCETFIDITSKETTHLGAENVISAIFYYTLITSFVAGTINILFQEKRRFKEIFERKNLKFAWFFMSFAVLHSMLKTYTMYLSPNPAYVAAIVHAYPVWIMLGNNYLFAFAQKGHYIKIKPQYLILLLVSIVCLILMVEE